jgi:hypothetical protein
LWLSLDHVHRPAFFLAEAVPEPQPRHSVGVATAQLVIGRGVEGGAIIYFAFAVMEKQE